MPEKSYIEGINDSKKISEKKREIIYEKIIKEAIEYKVAIIDEKVIDEINILNATKKAVNEVIKSFIKKPDYILIDALDNIETNNIPYEAIIKGDTKIYSIAAASIIAKVTRDRIMKKYEEKYPRIWFC
jgi:ribonuclease HII